MNTPTAAQTPRAEGGVSRSVWVIDLPFHRPLSLNDRMSEMALYRAKKTWRTTAAEAYQAAGIPALERARLTMLYVPRYNRRHDEDNPVLSMKPLADALVDAGVIPDDTRDYLERVWPMFTEPVRERPQGRIQVIVERVA